MAGKEVSLAALGAKTTQEPRACRATELRLAVWLSAPDTSLEDMAAPH